MSGEAEEQLKALRAAVDAADEALLQALAARARAVAAVWAWKRQAGVAQFDGPREAGLRQRLLTRAAELGLAPDAVAAVLDRVVGKDLGPGQPPAPGASASE